LLFVFCGRVVVFGISLQSCHRRWIYGLWLAVIFSPKIFSYSYGVVDTAPRKRIGLLSTPRSPSRNSVVSMSVRWGIVNLLLCEIVILYRYIILYCCIILYYIDILYYIAVLYYIILYRYIILLYYIILYRYIILYCCIILYYIDILYYIVVLYYII